jgi:alkanesulfonate monooxygenase SsuD/methylene tetrahydromethanopterin reductase-like flavin-dependent oxidoreductase (luciferase family)
MHYGTFHLMGYKSPKTTEQILRETRDEVRLAEQAGFEIAWFAEHHFSNYCVCPSPLMMAAHCAAVTTRIRLAPGVIVAPLYQPARLLAEIGMVDAMSGGRLVLGLGSGYQPFEFERFGLKLADSKTMTEEFIELVELAFSRDVFSYEGRHYKLKETHIAARPSQRRLEVWLAGDSPQLQRVAARKGFAIIANGRFGDGRAVRDVQRRNAEESWRAEGKDPARLPLGVLRFACVTDSKAEAREFAENARWQLRLAGALRRREEAMEGHMLVEKPGPNEPTLDEIQANLMAGDPETVAARAVDDIRHARPVHVSLMFQVGDFDHRRAVRSMERFAAEVVPLIEREVGPLGEVPGTRLQADGTTDARAALAAE